MSREPRKPQKDRTSLVIAAVMHAVLIGGVLIWAWKTGKLEEITNKILQVVTDDKKKEEKKPEPVQQKQQAPTAKLPPINQGAQPSASRGTRMAVASDAPGSDSDSFFQDNREQVNGPTSAGGAGAVRPTNNVPSLAPRTAGNQPRPMFAPPAKTTIKQLLLERSTEAAAVEAVGAEQISKAAATDASAVVSKIAGATIVDGKFAVIRGLSDRYIATTFNGGEIPSADPYRRAPSLDMFPAQVIDKVVVSKTFTPDLDGTSTGGSINIVSKSFPEKPFISLSLGGAYNTSATGNKNFLTYQGGGKDWLGMDDGTRSLPAPLDDQATTIPGRVDSSGPRTGPNYQANIHNAETLDAYTKLLGTTQFAPDREAPPWNQAISLAAGETAFLCGMPFGVFSTFNYRREFQFAEQYVNQRYEPTSGGGTELSYTGSGSSAADVVNWGAMFSFTLQPHPDHDIGFNYLFNQNARDTARVEQGVEPDEPTYTIYKNRLQFTERSLSAYQFKGESRLPEVNDIKLDWVATLSDTTQDEPDLRFFNFYDKGGTFVVGDNGLPTPNVPTRYWRDLQEDNQNFKADLTIPFRQWSAAEAQLKTGLFSGASKREFEERQMYYPGGEFDGNPNNYLQPDNLGILAARTNAANGRIAYDWGRYIQSFDSFYDAEQSVKATYLMLDTPVVERVRVVGGVRVETTDLSVHSSSFTASSITGQRVNNTELNETDVLPAVGLILNVYTNMNVRLHYSETLARPSFREIAAYRSDDPDLDVGVEGNPLLQMTHIKNYDLRWEWFPTPGDLLGVSFYRKDLTDAIEREYVDLTGNIITYRNRPEATVNGWEFEARKNLGFLSLYLTDWSVGGNLALVQSEAELSADEVSTRAQYGLGSETTRPLYDQSPYVLNLDVNYDNPRLGTSASLILNMAGPRITIANLTTKDVYEHPPETLDFVLSQKIGRNLTCKFVARNLLDPKIERTYGAGEDQLYSSYRRGRTFGIALTYDY